MSIVFTKKLIPSYAGVTFFNLSLASLWLFFVILLRMVPLAKEINNHRNADNLSWPESKLMNQLEETNGKLSEFIPDTSNPSKRT